MSPLYMIVYQPSRFFFFLIPSIVISLLNHRTGKLSHRQRIDSNRVVSCVLYLCSKTVLKTLSRKNVSVSCIEQRALSGDPGLEALSPYTNLLTAPTHFYVKTSRLKTQYTDVGLFGFSTRRLKTLLNRCRSSRYRIKRHEFVRSVDSFWTPSIVVPNNFKKRFTISFCLITVSTVQNRLTNVRVRFTSFN